VGCPTFVSRQTRLLIPCRSHDEVLSKMWSADRELAHGFDVRADSLEPKNGSLIKGVFIGGEREQLSGGLVVQTYNLSGIVSPKFDSERAPDLPTATTSSLSEGPGSAAGTKKLNNISPKLALVAIKNVLALTL